MIKDKIKAVFWDLDDTLWQGILAEGENIEIFAERKRIIEQLNHRGIVNSVCSKNEYQTARKKLIEFGCWEMFVFPQIAFQPKGEMIRRTLKDMNLRAENILFIDDNDANLKEVEYYNPGISTLISDAVSEDLLLNPNLQGKPDQNLSRVNQYKVLEKKTSAKKESISNYEFMHSCHIKLWLIPYNDSYFERVYELSDRTNQLNFTKKRMSQDELRDMLSDDQIETMLCRVSDDYGDYGIVGFYSKHNNRLLHYVFSCRIMNMGIEQYIYHLLDCPEITVKGNTASEVGKNINNPDWIELIYSTDGSFENEYSSSDSMNSDTKAEIRIYGIGACDLFHVMSYFDTPGQTLVYDCNYYKGDERAVNVATEDIRASFDMTDDEKIFCREHFYNYTGEDCFSGKILQNKYDYVVMSFHDDMALQIFTSRDDPNLRVVRTDDTRIAETNLICNGVFMSRKDQLKWLEDHFYPGEYISEERFYDNLTWIRKQLPIETKLILITSPELDFYRKRFPHVPEVRNQIIRLNHVIRRICAEYPENTGLVELNDIIISTDDITDYIYHFTAQKAWEIYGGIVETMRRFGYNASGCGQEPCLGNTRCQLSYNPSGEDWGDDIDIGIRRQYQVSDNPVWINQTWDDFNIYAKDRQIIVFGAGVGLAFYLSENESIRSLRIVDNDADKIGTPASLYLSLKGSDIESLMKHPAIRGVTVENPSILTSIEQADAVILIANLRYYDDIQMQVEKLGKWRVYSLMQMEARQRGAVHD